MDRIPKKVNFPKVNFSDKIVPEIETAFTSNLSKWLPLIAAGAAAGVSIIALKELKSVRNELNAIKQGPNEELSKRMQAMEDQLRTLTNFIKNKSEPAIVKLNVKKENIRIINDEEYEEVEVTDDEAEEVAEVKETNEEI